MNKDIAIKVENLSKVYKLYNAPIDRMKEALNPFKKLYHKEFYALNDLSFEIKKGETVGIIGKNGSGKSTLLKIITGVLNQTSGKVTVSGRISALLELGAGFNPEYTGMENIYFQGNLMGFEHEEMESKVQEILDFADIGDFIHQPVKNYSSGMFARLAFAVAINVEPEILIVDEALSVGDMAFQAKCFNKFKEFRDKGITILFVTHSTDLILKYCQSAVLINEGIKIKDGDCKDTVETFRKLMVNIARKNVEQEEEKQAKKEDKPLVKQRNLKEQLTINPTPIVYGSMEAEIIDFGIINDKGIITNQLYHDEDYVIQMTVKFDADIIDPIFAYTLKSVDGLELTGTNSLNLNQVFGKIKAGEKVTVRFNQNMILNSGQYLLSLGCTKYQDGNLTVFHRLYDVVAVEVISTISATGIAFSVSDFSIERE